jgi:hypothetical protein
METLRRGKSVHLQEEHIVKNAITLAAVFLLTSFCFAKYSGGTGEPNDPYLIATPEDLNSIGLDANDWDKHFLMTADINMAGITGDSFNIIGRTSPHFTGVFDGNDNTIFNFTYSATESYTALFARTDADCVIKDLSFCEPNISGGDYVAALAGYFSNGHVSNCRVISGTITGGNIVAGLIGWCDSGEIINCGSTADVNCQSSDFAGGLIAVSDANVSGCYAVGDVSGFVCVGGLIGASSSGAIFDCYAGGNVTGHHYVGGFIGSVWPDLGISRCYAVGAVSGADRTGAFSDDDGQANYTKCFWDSNINPDMNGLSEAIDPNVVGLPTAQMQMRSTFADAGWDMINIWDIGENQTYPFLRTHLPGDIDKDNNVNLFDLSILAENWLKEE